jgi:hypothetical protein
MTVWIVFPVLVFSVSVAWVVWCYVTEDVLPEDARTREREFARDCIDGR